LGHLICDAFETAHASEKVHLSAQSSSIPRRARGLCFICGLGTRCLLNPFNLAVPHAYSDVGDGGGFGAMCGHDYGCAELVGGAADQL